MIHDHYIIIKLQQNPKNHRPKNKTAPTFNKKSLFFFKKNFKKKSPLKGENQGKKKQNINFKKTSEQN
jgi:hypothetical protein